MSKELRAAGLEAKFASILRLADELSDLDLEDRAHEYTALAGVIESYQSARKIFVEITGLSSYLDGVGLDGTSTHRGYPDYGNGINQVITNSESAIAYLRTGREQVPTEVKDKLKSLEDSIAIVRELNPNLHEHLVTAIHEHERTHYLAASVLASKTIDYALSKLDGSDEATKADGLVRKGLLKSDLKDGFVRTWKKARNYYIHDITSAPPAEESLSILSNACQLSIFYTKSQ